MFDDKTLAERENTAPAGNDAELFALIAEREQHLKLMDEAEIRAIAMNKAVEAKLPPARVEIGLLTFKNGSRASIEAESESEIDRGLFLRKALHASLARQAEIEDLVCFDEDRRDELVAELHARKKALSDAMAAAGGEQLWYQAGVHAGNALGLLRRIEKVRPVTVKGALALIELAVDTVAGEIVEEEMFASALAALREIAAREAR